MYQKTLPKGGGLQKKDSFRIAAWESSSKDKRKSVKSKSRFKKTGGKVEEEKINWTIATERI
jgi:hypothetical protein